MLFKNELNDMMKLPSIQQILRTSSQAAGRFPFVLMDAAIGTTAALILIDHEGPPGPTILFNILWAAIPGIPLFTALTLVAEKKRWAKSVSVSIQMAGVFLLAAYASSVPSDLTHAPNIHILRLLILSVALHLSVAVAPFAGRSDLNGFWHYNKTLFLRLFTAILFSVVLFAGLSIALAALDHLFGINVPEKRYFELWGIITGLFTTCFFLAGIPKDLDGLDALSDYPQALKIFAQYILFPLVVVYLLILYAYLIKILIDWSWPQGWVTRLILGFATAGILSLLLLYPIRDRVENVWVRNFSRWFYVSMIPLVVMLFLAVWTRISEYGMTEGRYIVVALAIWLTGLVAYFIVSKGKNIKVIPGSLCVLSFLVSFGPWGAFDVSANSQTARLKNLLEKDSILVDGAVQKAHAAVSFEDAKQISSIIGYLHEVHGYDRIQPWFHESLRQDSTGMNQTFKEPAAVATMIGIEYVNVWVSAGDANIMLNADREGAMDIEGYDRMLRVWRIGVGQGKGEFHGEQMTCRVNPSLDTMTIVVMPDGKPKDSLAIDLRRLVDKLLTDFANANAANIPPEKMSIENANQSMKVKVYLPQLQVRRERGEVKLVWYDAEILYTIK